jgi:8-oxo-dGTP diphosphatase
MLAGWPSGAWRLAKEAARHLLRRPVAGVAVLAQDDQARWLLIRRADTGLWALPGGTLEWGETVTQAARRELWEETACDVLGELALCGVYSSPARDPRFHAVTVLVRARVRHTGKIRPNPLEIREYRFFPEHEIPGPLSHGMGDFLRSAHAGNGVLE